VRDRPASFRALLSDVAPAALAAIATCSLWADPARAQDLAAGSEGSAAIRPTIQFNRWQEDWSVLADPDLRTEPLDSLKYIPLSSVDPQSYASLGGGLRERFESNDASFGVGHHPEDYVIQRLELDADVHPDASWQIFAQLEDDRVFWKEVVTPVDADKLDLEQAFVAYKAPLFGGEIKARVGRQEMGFDLQRFVGVRDGPNVRQAFDAVWLDWEKAPWRFITFLSHPVQYADVHPFDDFSNSDFRYGGFRVERNNVGTGSLSAYYSRYYFDNARFLFASGNERRDVLDARYAGASAGFDWDLESMGQGGRLGPKQIHAWAVGSISGYTFKELGWLPRIGLQLDAASGNARSSANTIGTFNPLFPNGYYVTLSGYTGDTNILHFKPSITVAPVHGLKLMGAVGLLWRETTADAIYVQPDIPVAGTAGRGGRWSAAYAQLRADYTVNANLTGAVEINRYAIGDTIRSAGGRDSDYVGVELKYQW
jgi:hypothetical protein